jgi:hypothetical protein
MNSLESRSHGHKYFEYEFCTPTRSKTIQYWMVFAVFMGCDVLIGWFSLYLWGLTFWFDGFLCIYRVWRSDWMFFAVFMGCDVLIGWFLLYLWGVTFWLDGFRSSRRTKLVLEIFMTVWSTSHPINTANNWTILECENGTCTRKFYEPYETWSNIQNPYALQEKKRFEFSPNYW